MTANVATFSAFLVSKVAVPKPGARRQPASAGAASPIWPRALNARQLCDEKAAF
ncbi:hypothetical protein TRM7557_02763 [Tritonibacter multivorans]|uniref:Uncharacterized protein n=1 Tax=Tritonibacter multivorans TaxID=928856 RepID=A0A0P1GFL7_9RHOB|nr:hypothetical protein TRM7557_02763 [Tritonibacter multivorans]SFC75468.1 hypothetical protein SAMN04488049_10445 [Tritonibacter multivorans]